MSNAHFKQFSEETEPAIELRPGNASSGEAASSSGGNDQQLQSMEEGGEGDTGAAVLLKAHGLGKFALPLNEVRMKRRLEF